MCDRYNYNPYSLHGGLIETIEHRSDAEAAEMARQVLSGMNMSIPTNKQFYSKSEADFIFLTDYGLVLSFRHKDKDTYGSEETFENVRVNRDALILAPFVQAPLSENCLFEISPAIISPVSFPDRDTLQDMLEYRGFCFWDAQTDNAGYIRIPDTDILLPVVLDRGAVKPVKNSDAKPTFIHEPTLFEGHDVSNVQREVFADFQSVVDACWKAGVAVPDCPEALKEFFNLAGYHAALDMDNPEKKLFTSWVKPSPYDRLQLGISRVAETYAPRALIHV